MHREVCCQFLTFSLWIIEDTLFGRYNDCLTERERKQQIYLR